MLVDSTVCKQKVTPDLIRSKKGRQRITFVTACDFPTAKLVDEAGFDMVLIGDTLAEVVLGHETTLPVTFEAMLHHTCAARRAIKRALLVADLPYGTYHVSENDAVRFGVRFVKEGGAQAVKLEGGRSRVNLIRRMLDAEIPMMGHIGLTPNPCIAWAASRFRGESPLISRSCSPTPWPWTMQVCLRWCWKGSHAKLQRSLQSRYRPRLWELVPAPTATVTS